VTAEIFQLGREMVKTEDDLAIQGLFTVGKQFGGGGGAVAQFKSSIVSPFG
jgi:hypothetical protein